MRNDTDKELKLPPELAATDEELFRISGDALRARSNSLSSGFADRIVKEATQRRRVETVTSPARRGVAAVYRLAAAFAAILVIGAAGVLWIAGQQPVGNVSHSKLLSEEGRVIRPGDVLRAESAMTAQLDDGRIHLMLKQGAVLEVRDSDDVFLREGAAWFHVRSNSGHFACEVPSGEVAVVGTSFGVSLEGEELVQVTRGKVRYTISGMESFVSAGESCSESGAVIQSGSNEPPAWATELVSEETQDRIQLFFPSAAPVE